MEHKELKDEIDRDLYQAYKLEVNTKTRDMGLKYGTLVDIKKISVNFYLEDDEQEITLL